MYVLGEMHSMKSIAHVTGTFPSITMTEDRKPSTPEKFNIQGCTVYAHSRHVMCVFYHGGRIPIT